MWSQAEQTTPYFTQLWYWVWTDVYHLQRSRHTGERSSGFSPHKSFKVGCKNVNEPTKKTVLTHIVMQTIRTARTCMWTCECIFMCVYALYWIHIAVCVDICITYLYIGLCVCACCLTWWPQSKSLFLQRWMRRWCKTGASPPPLCHPSLFYKLWSFGLDCWGCTAPDSTRWHQATTISL